LLVVQDYTRQFLWDATTGQRIGQLSSYPSDMRFTRDGRGLVVIDGSAEENGSNLKLYDLAEGKFVREMAVGKSGAFALSPDNKTVTTGQTNGSLLVWDATSFLKPLALAKADLSEKEMLALWADLGGDDARKALRARWKLASAKGAAAFLKGKLSTAKGPSAEEVAASIAALDSDRFATREQATRALEQWGEQVEPALTRALGDWPSPEKRRRLEALLDRLKNLPLRELEQARALRGVAVLEAAGDAEARALLRALSDGGGSRVGTAARAALKRLGER
jgi:hypothetical protein